MPKAKRKLKDDIVGLQQLVESLHVQTWDAHKMLERCSTLEEVDRSCMALTHMLQLIDLVHDDTLDLLRKAYTVNKCAHIDANIKSRKYLTERYRL